MVSVPLDVLKQYLGIFVKMGLYLVHNFLIEGRRCYGVVGRGIGGSTLSSFSTFQQLWTSKHHEVSYRHPQVFARQGRVVRQRRHVPLDR